MNSCFLVKIEIDFEMAYKAGLIDSYNWHQKSWQAFPDRPQAKRDFLTRLDVRDEGFRLLMLASSLPVRPGWCPEPCWEMHEIPGDYWSHSTYHFSLVANPTKKIRSAPDGTLLKNSRRVPLVRYDELVGWLQRKGEQNGFSVNLENLRIIPRPRQTFVKGGKLGAHAVTEFVGTLAVTAPELFQKAARNGIGPAKAFGFGMLCLQPRLSAASSAA